jgi:hypothetical protein
MEHIESAFTNQNNLQYRMWKMVDDIFDHVVYGYGGALSQIDRIHLNGIPNINRIFEMYGCDDPRNIKTLFKTDLLPFLVKNYFKHTLPRHTSFLRTLPKQEKCNVEDMIDSDDCIEWEDIDTHIVKTLIEGYLRIRLYVENVDDVLCNGYDVEFTCSAFGTWFFDTFLIDSIKSIV